MSSNTTFLKHLDTPKVDKLTYIKTEKELRIYINNYPKILDKRIQSQLDCFSLEFIAVSSIAFLATSATASSFATLKMRSDLIIHDNKSMILPNLHHSLEKQIRKMSLNASVYFMVTGLGHGLRVNGTLTKGQQGLDFKIEQVYFHCARAVTRAEFWSPSVFTDITQNNIIRQSPFVLLKTMNAKFKTEVSPRGDKPGFIKVLSENTLLLPERPGNKVAVSLRNIIEHQHVELLFLVPGAYKTLNITGTANIIADQTLLSHCTVNGKTPKIGIIIHVNSRDFKESPALSISRFWNSSEIVNKVTSFSKALSAHINGTGLIGKATNTIVSAVIKHDMKNLY